MTKSPQIKTNYTWSFSPPIHQLLFKCNATYLYIFETFNILTIDTPMLNEDKKSPLPLPRARERKLREIKKTVLPTAVNNKAKTALPTVKLIRKFPSTKSEKLPVRPVPARHLAIDVRPRPSAIDVRPRPSAVDHRPSTIGDEQRRSLQVKVFVLTLFRLRG